MRQLQGLQKVNKELQKKVEEYLAGWQRCKADLENFKKQQDAWAENFKKYADKDILLEIIVVLDNFNTALKHIPADRNNAAWKEGFLYIKKQLEDILTSHGVKKIETKTGDVFDPLQHEGLESLEEKPPLENNKNVFIVKEVVCDGYILYDKILRPVRVRVEAREGSGKEV